MRPQKTLAQLLPILSVTAMSLFGFFGITGCKSQDPGAALMTEDMASTPDMATEAPDLLVPPPDLAMACGYGRSAPAGVCGCDSAHPVACSNASFCCGSGQQCGSGFTPSCSGPTGRQRLAAGYDPKRGLTLLQGGQCYDPVSGVETLCTDEWELNSVTFQNHGIVTGPTPRAGATLAFDAGLGGLLLFGGQTKWTDPNAISAETWLWNGSTWAAKTPATSPPARAMAGQAYDSTRRRMVLFGGVGVGDMALEDTWEWDGTTWTDRTPEVSPPAREGHGMTYDSKRQKIVMHGGLAGGMYASGTWTYDGTSWTAALPTFGMAARAYFPMAFDEARGVVVLFGGETPGQDPLADTWEWSGTVWQRKFPVASPPGRVGASMVYDAVRKVTLLFGGVNGTQGLISDVWAWDGTTWKQLS